MIVTTEKGGRMMASLDTNIQFLKGVGEKRARLYAKLGIATIGDQHFE